MPEDKKRLFKNKIWVERRRQMLKGHKNGTPQNLGAYYSLRNNRGQESKKENYIDAKDFINQLRSEFEIELKEIKEELKKEVKKKELVPVNLKAYFAKKSFKEGSGCSGCG